MLAIYPLIAFTLSFLLPLNFFYSILLFLALPSAYLTLRAKKYVKKASIFSIIASVPLIIVIDYIGQQSLSWAFASSIIPFTLFGIVQLEVILWAFFNIYFVILFYEYFLDNHNRVDYWKPRMKVLIWFVAILIFSFFFLYLVTAGNLAIPYFYLWFGSLLFGFPLIMQLIYYPKTMSKIMLTGAYFCYLSLLYEYAAVIKGWWHFPGTEFIGWITLLGVSFPLEEFIFWIVLFAISVLCAFEYLDDDER